MVLTPEELIGFDFMLTAEQRSERDRVREFVASRIRPSVARWFEQESAPVRELALELGALGVLGMNLEGYGCAGSDAVSYGLACMELEAGDSGVRSLVSVTGSLAMHAIWDYGSEEQKLAWLPGMARGELLGSFALTEPDVGSNPAAMRTNARRDGTDWVLNGAKRWITNGPVADVVIVWAQDTEGPVRGFIVPTDTPGLEMHTLAGRMSLRASASGAAELRDVRLPESAALPRVTGLRGPLGCLNEARFGIVFGAMGAARDCLESALTYADSRVQFDGPISGLQLTQAKFAEMTAKLTTGLLLAMRLADLKDAGELTAPQISLGKFNNVSAALDIARTSRSVLGGNGVLLEHSIIRHMNNLESVYTYEGTHEIHSLVLGQALTGQAAYRQSRED